MCEDLCVIAVNRDYESLKHFPDCFRTEFVMDSYRTSKRASLIS